MSPKQPNNLTLTIGGPNIQPSNVDEGRKPFFEVPVATLITNHTPWLTVEVPETNLPTSWKDERPGIVHLHLPFALQVPKLVAIDHLAC